VRTECERGGPKVSRRLYVGPFESEGLRILRRIPIPNVHHPLSLNDGQALAVRAEGQPAGLKCVPAQGSDFLASLEIPDPHRPIPRTAGQALAVETEGEGADPGGMPLEDKEHLAGLGIPNVDAWRRRIVADADQALAVRAEGDGVVVEGALVLEA